MANSVYATSPSPPRHLALLQSMFPGKVLLDVDDIAKVLGYGKGHLYNLSSAGKLPFKVSCVGGNKIKVSVLELAAHLDRETLSEYEPTAAAAPRPAVVEKKRIGRPRGSTKRAKADGVRTAFQADLLRAAIEHEHRLATDGLTGALGAFTSVNEFEGSVAAAVAALARIGHHLAGVSADVPFASRRYPFFVQPTGLVTCLAVDLEATPLHQGAADQIVWMTWDAALAGVWEAESERLFWVKRMTCEAADLPQRIEDRRRARLLAMSPMASI